MQNYVLQICCLCVCCNLILQLNILTVYDLPSQSQSSLLVFPYITTCSAKNDQWIQTFTGLNKQSSYEILYFWVFL